MKKAHDTDGAGSKEWHIFSEILLNDTSKHK